MSPKYTFVLALVALSCLVATEAASQRRRVAASAHLVQRDENDTGVQNTEEKDLSEQVENAEKAQLAANNVAAVASSEGNDSELRASENDGRARRGRFSRRGGRRRASRRRAGRRGRRSGRRGRRAGRRQNRRRRARRQG